MKKWRCTACGYIHTGETPPEQCPKCKIQMVLRELLDEYAGHHELMQQLTEAFQLWRTSEEKLRQLISASSERKEQLELLRYQVSELNELKLGDSELEELDREHSKLSNVGRLQSGCDYILTALYDDENAIQGQLSKIQSELEQ